MGYFLINERLSMNRLSIYRFIVKCALAGLLVGQVAPLLAMDAGDAPELAVSTWQPESEIVQGAEATINGNEEVSTVVKVILFMNKIFGKYTPEVVTASGF